MRSLEPPPTQVPLLAPAPQGAVARIAHEWGRWFATVARVNPWNVVASFSNSWANVGGAYYNAAYHQDVFGVVRLRGRIHNGTSGATAFTLPEGFRPNASMAFIGDLGGNTREVIITAAGLVQPTYTGASTDISLDNISFIAEA